MSYWHFEISVKSAKRGLKSKIRVFSAEGAPQEVREVVYGGTIERQAIHVNGRASNGLLIRFCSPSHRDGVLFTSTLRMFLRLKFQALHRLKEHLTMNPSGDSNAAQLSKPILYRRASATWSDEELEAERERLHMMKVKFVDDEFENSLEFHKRFRNKKLHWLRPSEIFPEHDTEDLLFGPNGAIENSTVRQGLIGDCFFVAAVVLLSSSYPERIKHLFVTQQYNEEGMYCFQFFKDGKWKRVVIDDRLPCRKVTLKGSTAEEPRNTVFRLVLAQSSNPKSVWVSLVEKAYAKLYGSYGNICGGNVSEALVDLSGCAVRDVSLERPQFRKPSFFKSLHDDVQSGALVGCALCVRPGTDATNAEKRCEGILANHAYSVMKTCIVPVSLSLSKATKSKTNPSSSKKKTKAKQYERIVLVRNPQGSGAAKTFKGVYHDLGLISDEIKEGLGISSDVGLGKGEFLMNWTEFLNAFNRVYIGAIHILDSSKLITFEGKWSGRSAAGCTDNASWRFNPMYLIRLESDAEIHICLQQNDRKIERKRKEREQKLRLLEEEEKQPDDARDTEAGPNGEDGGTRDGDDEKDQDDVKTSDGGGDEGPSSDEEDSDEENEDDEDDVETSDGGGDDGPSSDEEGSDEEKEDEEDDVETSDDDDQKDDDSGDEDVDGEAATVENSINYEMIGLSIVMNPVAALVTNPDLETVSKPLPSPFVLCTSDETIAQTSFWNKRDVSVHSQLKANVDYLIVPCTYTPGHEAPFCLNVYAPAHTNATIMKRPIEIQGVDNEESGDGAGHVLFREIVVKSKWTQKTSGGPARSHQFGINPKFILRLEPAKTEPVSELASDSPSITLFLAIEQFEKNREKRAGIGVCVLRKGNLALEMLRDSTSGKKGMGVGMGMGMGMSTNNMISSSWFLNKTIFSNAMEVYSTIAAVNMKDWPLLLVPCTWKHPHCARFRLLVYYLPSQIPSSYKLTMEEVPSKSQ